MYALISLPCPRAVDQNIANKMTVEGAVIQACSYSYYSFTAAELSCLCQCEQTDGSVCGIFAQMSLLFAFFFFFSSTAALFLPVFQIHWMLFLHKKVHSLHSLMRCVEGGMGHYYHFYGSFVGLTALKVNRTNKKTNMDTGPSLML